MPCDVVRDNQPVIAAAYSRSVLELAGARTIVEDIFPDIAVLRGIAVTASYDDLIVGYSLRQFPFPSTIVTYVVPLIS
jgi:hypothetical protein